MSHRATSKLKKYHQHIVYKKIVTISQVKIKDPIFLKSFLVYKFVYARCNSSYIGETCRHFKTRIDEHLKKDKKSNISKHLHNNEECRPFYFLFLFIKYYFRL